MCQMRAVVLREMLGNREIGWTLWDGKQVMEMTSKQVKDTITRGKKVCGLTVDESGDLVRDVDGFFCTNIMEHRHCGNYVPMVEGGMANMFYICIGQHEENGRMIFDCISTKFEQLKVAEEEMRAYLKIGIVSAGVREKDGVLEVADLEFNKPEETTESIVEVKSVVDEKSTEFTEPREEAPVEANVEASEVKTDMVEPVETGVKEEKSVEPIVEATESKVETPKGKKSTGSKK